jgi:hypothetical protein
MGFHRLRSLFRKVVRDLREPAFNPHRSRRNNRSKERTPIMKSFLAVLGGICLAITIAIAAAVSVSMFMGALISGHIYTAIFFAIIFIVSVYLLAWLAEA